MLATMFSFSYHFTSRENSGGLRHLLDLGLFFSYFSFFLSFLSRFSLIYTSENGFWLWAYRRMGKLVGSIMNNCILYGFWRFHCSSRRDSVIITNATLYAFNFGQPSLAKGVSTG